MPIEGNFNAGIPRVAPYVGPGDIVSGAGSWYGLRAYTAAIAIAGTQAAVNIRRGGDNVTADVLIATNGGLGLTANQSGGAPGDNGLTPAAFSTHGGGNGTLFVTKLYDQSGNGRDVSQATAANQPNFVLNALGSFPAVQSTLSPLLYLTGSGSGTRAQPYTSSGVIKKASSGSGFAALGDLQTEAIAVGEDLSNVIMRLDGSTTITVAQSNNTWYAVQGLANGASSELYINGSAHTGLAGSASNWPGTNVAVCNDSFSSGWDGSLMEVGIWFQGDQSANFSTLNNNQRNYWGF